MKSMTMLLRATGSDEKRPPDHSFKRTAKRVKRRPAQLKRQASEPQMSSYGTLCTEFYDLDKSNAPPHALDFYTLRVRAAGGRVLERAAPIGWSHPDRRP